MHLTTGSLGRKHCRHQLKWTRTNQLTRHQRLRRAYEMDQNDPWST
jgi:hypothetical protein